MLENPLSQRICDCYGSDLCAEHSIQNVATVHQFGVREKTGQFLIVKSDDANDVLCALEASHDYDPGPNLEKIRAQLLKDQLVQLLKETEK